jgi:RimJ/RimL family protein N-acetyltransferase
MRAHRRHCYRAGQAGAGSAGRHEDTRLHSTHATDGAFDGPRFRARSLCADDRALVVALFADAQVMTHVAAPMSDEAAGAYFERLLRHTQRPPAVARAHFWALTHSRTGEALGIVSLVRDAEGSRSGEIGVMLLPQAHASGVGLHALDALVDALVQDRWGFGLDRVWGRFQVANGVVRKVAVRLGFVPDLDGPDDGSERWVLSAAAWQARALPKTSSIHMSDAHA